MRIRFNRDLKLGIDGGAVVTEGDVVDLPDDLAASFVEQGVASKTRKTTDTASAEED